MRRASSNEETMDERRVRIRLKFVDLEVLTSQQIEQGLEQSWYLVRLEDVHTIDDVAFDIKAAFHLQESCPNGLGLEVDGFVLPSSQPASLLKDSDLVRIKRRNDNHGPSLGHISHRGWNGHVTSKTWLPSGSHRFNGCCGELRALEETGGYESEEEEGEMETDISLDGRVRTLVEARVAPGGTKEKDRGGKRRKRAKTDVSEVGKSRKMKDVELGLELAVTEVKEKCNLVGCRVSQCHGVELHTDEFEKGAEEDIEEGDEEVTVLSWEGKRSMKKHNTASLSTRGKQEKNEKKRKKGKKVNSETQDQCFQIEECRLSSDDGVQCTGGAAKDVQHKVKRKKLHHSGAHSASANVKLTVDNEQVKVVEADCEDGLEEGTKTSTKKKTKRKKKKSAEVNGSDVDENKEGRESMLKTGMTIDKIGKTKRKKNSELESPPEKPRTPESNVNGGSTPAGIPKDEIKETQVDVEQRPSRSARRKKAKRHWLREQQAKIAELPGVNSQVSNGKKSTLEICEGKSNGLSTDKVIEMEAEEETLPIIVRAGHIRFEPFGKGESPAQCQPSLPIHWLGDQLKSKRQGQNWGQERSAETRMGKRWVSEAGVAQSPEGSHDARRNTRSECQMDPVSFEKLPPLKGVPQVGVVTHWEPATSVVKLDPHPDYPSFEQDASREDDEDLSNIVQKESVGPYDENGSLEIELHSLMEVRLILRDLPMNDDVIPELDPTAASRLVDKSTPEPTTEVIDIGASTKELPGTKLPTTLKDGETLEYAPAWQDLVLEEIERKKMELNQKYAADTNASQGTLASSEHTHGQQDIPITSESNVGKAVREMKTAKGRKFKYLKSAGVGTIVALLRAQQAL